MSHTVWKYTLLTELENVDLYNSGLPLLKRVTPSMFSSESALIKYSIQCSLTIFSTEGYFLIGKRYQRGVKVVCKLKFGKLLDNKKDFRSKNFFGAEPRALKVEWVANFGISKS